MKIPSLGIKPRALAAGAVIALLPMALVVPQASAAVQATAHTDKVVSLTSAELREAGFPRRPNTTAWGNGSAAVAPTRAAVNEEVLITGKAPKSVKPGTVLFLQRFLPSDKKGSGSFQNLDLITSTVDRNGSFTMKAYLGRVGLWGYRVGTMTTGDSPEFIGFQFQLRTTAS